MDLRDDLKQAENIVLDFVKRVDSIDKEFCSHLESLKMAKKKDREKMEAELRNYVVSLRTTRDKKEAVNHRNDPLIPENPSQPEPPEYHDLEIHKDKSQYNRRKVEVGSTIDATPPHVRPAPPEDHPDIKICETESQNHIKYLRQEHSESNVYENQNMQLSKNRPPPETELENSNPNMNKKRTNANKNELEVSKSHSQSELHEEQTDLKIDKTHLEINKTLSNSILSENHYESMIRKFSHKNLLRTNKKHKQPELSGECFDPKSHKNRLENVKNHSQPAPPEEHSGSKSNRNQQTNDNHPSELPDSDDDDFLSGPVYQKPKKPLCLSTKKSAKTQSKCTARKVLFDSILDEEQIISSMSKDRGSDAEQPRISISWTIKIKESSSQHTNHVRITGSERVNLATPQHCKPMREVHTCNVREHEEQQGNSKIKRWSISDELHKEKKNLETPGIQNTIVIHEGASELRSSQHKNQEGVIRPKSFEQESPHHCTPLSDFLLSNTQGLEIDLGQIERCSISDKLGAKTDILETVETPYNTETPEEATDEGVRNTTCKNFQECRVVVRKLSTSHNIFQPKVVLRKLTDDEVRKICAPYSGISECEGKSSGTIPNTITEESRSDPTVRYTSLILEPARKFPRMFSTVKMRCSIMRLVLTPPQVNLKKETRKITGEPTTGNEIVKSMFKTKSKCVHEWRSRTKAKDLGKCEPHPRKSLPGVALMDGEIAKCSQEIKRSKCTQGRNFKSRTKDIHWRTYSNPKSMESTARMLEPETRSRDVIGQGELKNVSVQDNHDTGDTRKGEKEVSKTNSNQDESSSENRDSGSNLRKHEDSNGTIRKSWNGVATACPSPFADSSGDLKGRKTLIKETHEKSTSNSTEPLNKNNIDAPNNQPDVSRKERSAHTKFKSKNKSPKKMAFITPTRLKYSVKSQSKSVHNSPIQNGRVTRSRIQIEHSNSASHSKTMFPGSQLTFLIESFRR